MHRPWRPLLVLAIATLAFGVSVAGAARSGDLRDEFTTFDVHQWFKSSRPFGWGAVDPANVSVSNGQLGIRLPGGSLNGGEVRSLSLTRFGSYRARIKVSTSAVFADSVLPLQKPDFAQELDIEIFNDSSRRVWFSTYSGGRQTNTIEKLLPFDATTGSMSTRSSTTPGWCGSSPTGSSCSASRAA